MIADSGERRRQALKVCALATGLADKAVSLIYERVLRKRRPTNGSHGARLKSRTSSTA